MFLRPELESLSESLPLFEPELLRLRDEESESESESRRFLEDEPESRSRESESLSRFREDEPESESLSLPRLPDEEPESLPLLRLWEDEEPERSLLPLRDRDEEPESLSELLPEVVRSLLSLSSAVMVHASCDVDFVPYSVVRSHGLRGPGDARRRTGAGGSGARKLRAWAGDSR